jgi:anti-sigma factor RsiW
MRPDVSEHDEFLLSLLLDGGLDEGEAEALRLRLEREPALRRAYDSLRGVDDLLQGRRGDQPAVDLDAFHSTFMDRLAAERDEVLLGRLLDGELGGEEVARLRRRLEAEPALQACYRRLSRLHGALVERRADRPAVDYERFHRRVMKRIRAEVPSTGRVIRFPVWTRVAAVVAAAAAIMLAVWVQPGRLQPRTGGPGPEEGVARVEPSPGSESVEPEAPAEPVILARAEIPQVRDSGELSVEIARPDLPTAEADRKIQVSYSRSAEIADAVRQGDDERAKQAPVKVFFVSASAGPARSAAGAGDLF